MTVLSAEEVKKLVVKDLPDWIEEQPKLRRRLRETLGEVSAQSLRQTQGRPSQKTPHHKMTYDEFLAWADEDTLAEWVDGEVVMTSPASNRHQDIADFLVSVLRPFVEVYQLGIVRSAPFQMKLERGREPDLLFVASENLDRLKETYLDGPADIVVEIVSPEGLERDRGAKFVEYEAGGIPEYWLIDPLRRWAEFYRLGENGRYRTAFAADEGEYQSRALSGFWLRVESKSGLIPRGLPRSWVKNSTSYPAACCGVVDWLWQEPLPKTLDVLRELGLL